MEVYKKIDGKMQTLDDKVFIDSNHKTGQIDLTVNKEDCNCKKPKKKGGKK